MSHFKNDVNSTLTLETLGTFGTEWRWILDDIPVNTMTCTIAIQKCSMFEPGAADTNGSFQLVFEEMEMLSSIYEWHGDIDVEFGSIDAVWAAHHVDLNTNGSIVASMVEPVAILTPGRYVELNFSPLNFNSSVYIQGEGGDMDNCTFKELSFDGYAESTYVYLDLEFKRPECFMDPGIAIELETIELTMSGSGTVGAVASLELMAMYPSFAATGGDLPKITCLMEGLTFEASGASDVAVSLSAIFKKVSAFMAGSVEVMGEISLRLPQMTAFGWVGSQDYLGVLSAEFYAIRGEIDGQVGGVATIENCIFIKPSIEIETVIAGENNVDVSMKEPDIALLVAADCGSAETLSFGAQ